MNSIDWLIEKYTIVCGLGSKELMKEHIEKAKAMHKEEIEKAFYQGADDESNEHGIMYLDMNEAETYYNETFNK